MLEINKIVSAFQAIPTQSVLSIQPSVSALASFKDSITRSTSSLLTATFAVLNVVKTTVALIKNAHKEGVFTLSSLEKLYLKDVKKTGGFLSKLLRFVDVTVRRPSLKKSGIFFSKLMIAGLMIYANAFKKKELKKNIRLFSACLGLFCMTTTLQKLHKVIHKKGVSVIKLCKLCKKLASATAHTLAFASLVPNSAAAVSQMLYATGLLRAGCKNILIIHTVYDYVSTHAASHSLEEVASLV